VAGSDDVADATVVWNLISWFDCQFHSTLLDLADEPLIEEYI